MYTQTQIQIIKESNLYIVYVYQNYYYNNIKYIFNLWIKNRKQRARKKKNHLMMTTTKLKKKM